MNSRKLQTNLALAVVLFGIGGCGIFNGKRGGPEQVGDLVGMIERVYVESEVSKERSRLALERLETIVSADFDGDAVAAFTELVASIERSEMQATRLRESIEPMKEAAEPVFQEWEKSLGEYASAAMRLRSQKRMEDTRKRFDAIVSAVEPTQAAYDALNKGLRDHALFLSHDFNPSSLQALQDDVANLSSLGSDLDRRLDECLLASRAYIETSALPLAAVRDGAGVLPVSEKRR